MSMPDIVSNIRSVLRSLFWDRRLQRWVGLVGAIALLNLLGGCAGRSTPEPRAITLKQQWVLNPGDRISGSLVFGSLGDISLSLEKGVQVKAPFNGMLEPSELDGCDFYSTPEIPAYLFRLCGLSNIAYGEIRAGTQMGKGNYVSFATLRKQPDGTWIIVEPARGVLERAIEK